MDVRLVLPKSVCFAAGCCLLVACCRPAVADPAYSIIDLGTGNPIFGTDSAGNGTVMASYGTAYTFNPAQNYTSTLLNSATQPVPTVDAAPGGYAEMPYAYSQSPAYAMKMNGSGLAAGIDSYGINGHLTIYTQAFVTQLQPNGTWGGTTPLWYGWGYDGTPTSIGILGVSATGQVLGYGSSIPTYQNYGDLYLYDTKTGTTTDLSTLISSAVPNLPLSPTYQGLFWLDADPRGNAEIDSQGRILLSAALGSTDLPSHELLLIPDGDSLTEAPVPEPGTIGIFAVLIGGWVAVNRRRWACR